MLLTRATRGGERTFYGWPMLGGLSLAQVASWGVLFYSFPVFVRSIEAEMGWSRSQVTGAFSVALLVSGVASVAVGHWLDARGARGLMTAGSVAGCLLLLALSRTTSLAAFYALWAGLGIAMAMVLYEPAFAVVATWFIRHRDRALTFLTLVGGLASTVMVPVASWLLENGWRSATTTLAVLLGVTTVPIHALVLRSSPAAVGQRPDGADELHESSTFPLTESGDLRPVLAEPRFWCLTTAFAVSSFVSVAACVHLIPYLGERHYSPMAAGTVLGLLGLMQLPGRMVYAPLRRRLTWDRAAAAVFVAQAAALAVLLASPGVAALVVFVGLFGTASGMATLLRASTVAELYGAHRYGRVSGVVALFGTCGRAGGPVGAALVLGAWHSYPLTFAGLAAILGLSAVLVLLPRQRSALVGFPTAASEAR